MSSNPTNKLGSGLRSHHSKIDDDVGKADSQVELAEIDPSEMDPNEIYATHTVEVKGVDKERGNPRVFLSGGSSSRIQY